jgi:hypothetical protein
VPVDQFEAMLQSALTRFFQLIAVMFRSPLAPDGFPVSTPEPVD